MATIAEQLTSLNTNISAINTEVGSQADLIAQIKAVVNSLPEASSGSSEDLEALGALCEWQVTTNSASLPVITVINYHPTYYLHFVVTEYDNGSLVDMYAMCIPPDSSDSCEGTDILGEACYFKITEVRWTASAT